MPGSVAKLWFYNEFINKFNFLEIFRQRMYSNNKNCGEAQKIKPNLVSALKLYATSIYCAI